MDSENILDINIDPQEAILLIFDGFRAIRALYPTVYDHNSVPGIKNNVPTGTLFSGADFTDDMSTDQLFFARD